MRSALTHCSCGAALLPASVVRKSACGDAREAAAYGRRSAAKGAPSAVHSRPAPTAHPPRRRRTGPRAAPGAPAGWRTPPRGTAQNTSTAAARSPRSLRRNEASRRVNDSRKRQQSRRPKAATRCARHAPRCGATRSRHASARSSSCTRQSSLSGDSANAAATEAAHAASSPAPSAACAPEFRRSTQRRCCHQAALPTSAGVRGRNDATSRDAASRERAAPRALMRAGTARHAAAGRACAWEQRRVRPGVPDALVQRAVREPLPARAALMQALGGRCIAPRGLRTAPRRASAGTPARGVQCRRALRVACGTAEAMALRTYHLDKLSAAESKALLARPRVDFSAILETVRSAVQHAAAAHASANAPAPPGAPHRGGGARPRRRRRGGVHGAIRRRHAVEARAQRGGAFCAGAPALCRPAHALGGMRRSCPSRRWRRRSRRRSTWRSATSAPSMQRSAKPLRWTWKPCPACAADASRAPSVRAARNAAPGPSREALCSRIPPRSPNASSCVRCAGAVGLYVPGGSAVLPSTALMLAVPAQIAGCPTGT